MTHFSDKYKVTRTDTAAGSLQYMLCIVIFNKMLYMSTVLYYLQGVNGFMTDWLKLKPPFIAQKVILTNFLPSAGYSSKSVDFCGSDISTRSFWQFESSQDTETAKRCKLFKEGEFNIHFKIEFIKIFLNQAI